MNNFGHKIKQMVFIYQPYISVSKKFTAVHFTGCLVPGNESSGIAWELQYPDGCRCGTEIFLY